MAEISEGERWRMLLQALQLQLDFIEAAITEEDRDVAALIAVSQRAGTFLEKMDPDDVDTEELFDVWRLLVDTVTSVQRHQKRPRSH